MKKNDIQIRDTEQVTINPGLQLRKEVKLRSHLVLLNIYTGVVQATGGDEITQRTCTRRRGLSICDKTNVLRRKGLFLLFIVLYSNNREAKKKTVLIMKWGSHAIQNVLYLRAVPPVTRWALLLKSLCREHLQGPCTNLSAPSTLNSGL